MKAKILSLGAMYFEITSTNFPISDTLHIETETVGAEYVVDPGGSAVYFARVCARLGLSPIFIGKMGDDSLGSSLEKMIIKAGITPAFIKSNNVQTNVAINYVRPDGKALMFVSGTSNQSLTPDEIIEKIENNLGKVKYLYLGGFFKLKTLLPMYSDVLKKAKKRNVKIILDHGRIPNNAAPEEVNMVRDIAGEVDYYFPSKDEFLGVWKEQDIEKAIRKVRRGSSTVIAVKDSENGAFGCDGDNTVHVPAFNVKPVNTVGAGDSFNAGFIRAQEEGLDLEESLKIANATAALKISRSELPKFEDVDKLCRMN